MKKERSERGTDLVSQIHHPARRGNSNKGARHKTLNARLLRCIGQVQLCGLVTGIYGADDHVNAFEKRNQVIDGVSSVADADLDAFGYQFKVENRTGPVIRWNTFNAEQDGSESLLIRHPCIVYPLHKTTRNLYQCTTDASWQQGGDCSEKTTREAGRVAELVGSNDGRRTSLEFKNTVISRGR